MTYCVGVLVDKGLVMLSDSRTNAGVDNIATYRKMTVWERPGDRVFCLLSAGNLAISQAVVNLIEEWNGPDNRGDGGLFGVTSMFRAARLVGSAIRDVYEADGKALERHDQEFNASFLLGGQVAGGRTRLFQIYAEGNFIQASEDTPFLQIGEHKYGKPILDRAVTSEMSLKDATKLALVSMDSTLRSNLSVGFPVDLLVYEDGARRIRLRRTLDEDDAYFSGIRDRWSLALRRAYAELPDPDWFDETLAVIHDISDGKS